MEMDLSESDPDHGLCQLLKVLKTLTTPKLTKSLNMSQDTSTDILNEVLKENLQEFKDNINKSHQLQKGLGDMSAFILPEQASMNNVDVRNSFVEIFLFLLHQICGIFLTLQKQNFSEKCKQTKSGSIIPTLEPDTLGASQIQTISTSLEFIVVLGICPYLSPGVGIPVSKRLGPGQILLATAHDYSAELPPLTRIEKLMPPLKLLCQMIEIPALQNLVISKHLHDLLAALFQLRFSTKTVQEQHTTSKTSEFVLEAPDRIKKPVDHETSATNCSVSTGRTILSEVYLSSPEQPWTLSLIRQHCNKFIDKCVRFSSTPHTLKTLLMLSGGEKSTDTVAVQMKAPTWYKRAVAALLRDVLIDPNSVQHLIALFITESQGGHEWQKCKAISQVIAQLPTTPNNVECFYKSITNQLMSILESSTNATNILIVRSAGAAVLELSKRKSQLVESVCFAPLFEPLMRISSKNDSLYAVEGDIIVTEKGLTSCIGCVHNLFVRGQEPHSPLLEKLQKVVGVIFHLLLAIRQGVSPIKSKCCDLLASYISYLESEKAVSCLMDMVKNRAEPGLHPDVGFSSGCQGGIQVIKVPHIGESATRVEDWTKAVDVVMDIISAMRKENFVPQIFIFLLQELTSIVKSEINSSTSGDIALPVRTLTSMQKSSSLVKLKEKMLMVNLLASLGEKYGDEVVSSGSHILLFAKATLERCVQICDARVDETTLAFQWETVSMAMGLLTAVLGGGIEIGDNSGVLDDILPLLTFVSESDSADPRVREMADDLKVAVATKGLVWAEISKTKSYRERERNKDEQQPMAPRGKNLKANLIEVLSETTLDEIEKKQAMPEQHECGQLEQAMKELCDPLLPVRGHGLIALARLVEDRSPEVKDKEEILLKVFLENVSHTDSYIYLAAVNGLAALSDVCHDQVIPCLTSEIRSKCLIKGDSSYKTKTASDLVLKLGEAIVKATRRLGEIAPKYRDSLLSSLLCGCRHPDPLTRASCLSGLAEVCRLLRFALGPVLHEIVTCCRDVISSDPCSEPRKAAAMTFTHILQGLGKDTVLALDDVLLEVYRILKQVLNHDRDDGVKVHASAALEELDKIMREVIFAKPELSKTITILGYQ